jgi:hypothetical protein
LCDIFSQTPAPVVRAGAAAVFHYRASANLFTAR